jgi:phosphoribosylaminoimidazolecarboxamide formyltransferase/IMP cyclohydrolase
MEILKTGKGGLSRTNIEDMNNAMNIVRYFNEAACAIMKHVNPSGVAAARKGDSLKSVFKRAWESDSVAAFGCVTGFNKTVDKRPPGGNEQLRRSRRRPGYAPETLPSSSRRRTYASFRSTTSILEPIRRGDDPMPLVISTMTDQELRTPAPHAPHGSKATSAGSPRRSTEGVPGLTLRWYVKPNVRSNGVVLADDRQTLGVGTGQQDRLIAVKQALQKAEERGHKHRLKDAVLASDGFFPFRDSIDALAKFGVKACCQPGGSIKDDEVIAACNEQRIAMAFTDERCFRHF